ncbi:hypothetical protein K7X08_023086 [Anisodus acutangulus]|uniref:F-box domain-containing protein n=1 Tax=Anisodus acutangulus TaxID=402998 RepID=A0A9Q1MGY5_9SOLA|nr:hypothetical protein K7X08_023086 [Anisodus acutangulus]
MRQHIYSSARFLSLLVGANVSSIDSTQDELNNRSLKPKLEDIPEACVAIVLSYFDPPEICKLARINRTFHAASSADFIWEPELPSNYRYILEELLGLNVAGMRKTDIFAKLSRPNSFDGGTKEIWIHKNNGGVYLAICSKGMTITGIDDRRYWNYIPTEESRFQTVAYLQQMWWLEVDGDLEFQFPAGTYSLFFRLQLGRVTKRLGRRVCNSDHVHGWDLKPVQFQLTTSNGQRAISRCYLDNVVITNGLAKQQCLRKFPQLSKIARVTEPDWITTEANGVGSNNSSWDVLKRDHNVYASLLQAMTTLNTSLNGCIGYAVTASSTDRFPTESVVNTLTPKDRYINRPSYWSSKGHADPDASETLIYKLKADLCVISEINVQPFEAFFQPGKPIYSAKSVRLRLGHPKNPEGENDGLHVPLEQPADDNFIWTYIPYGTELTYHDIDEQENCLQKFKLPEHVLCIGGYLQIELLGRVQRQHTDNLFYICVNHVRVLGRPLCPAFDIEILDPSGKFALKYNPMVFGWMLRSFSDETNMTPVSSEEEVVEHVGLMGFLLGGYHAGIGVMPWEVMDDEEMDEPVVL